MSKLQEMFEPGWYKALEDHLHSEAFRNIGRTLLTLSKKRVEITPKFSDTFRAFRECRWDNLNTVLLGQDPYPAKVDKTTYVADGLSFSSRYAKAIPKSLNHIYESIERDIYHGADYEHADEYDLSRWAKQGVLLLNTSLSLPIGGKSGSHIGLWSPFINYVLKTINDRKDSVAFGLFGSYAKAYKHLLTNETFGVYSCEHPAAVEYRSKGKWEDEHIFRSIDGYHKFKNNINIKW
jgi:uracil-DNA glycosylase